MDLNDIESSLPSEILRIIASFHHCNECYIKDNNKKIYCNLCNSKKAFRLNKYCLNCNCINNIYANYCDLCDDKLIKIIYCDSFTKSIVSNKIINPLHCYKNYNCKTCNILTLFS